MRTEELLTELDKILEEGWNLPLAKGKIIMDVLEARRALREIRVSLPEEVKQAKAIAKDRSDIIRRASKDAKLIIKSAEERAEKIIEHDELVVRARDKARKMEEKAKEDAQILRIAAQKYAYDIFKKTDELLSSNLRNFRRDTKDLKL
ncbi:MAG: hypothetical protein LBI55_03565 [Oscillospiraceae bacterium]|nr:hypothetical protein [Oscillospiraceae bacterium]